MKKYRCPIDATQSNKMQIIFKGQNNIRNKEFPNEKLICPNCHRIYKWKNLREMDIYNG